MSSIHVLSGGTANRYTVVVHASTPAGNNSAGVSWSDAIKNSGRNTTIMTVGNGAGQIAQNEANNVIAGTVIEGTFQWDDNPAWTNQQRLDDINARATILIAELQTRYAAELKYFGFVSS